MGHKPVPGETPAEVLRNDAQIAMFEGDEDKAAELVRQAEELESATKKEEGE